MGYGSGAAWSSLGKSLTNIGGLIAGQRQQAEQEALLEKERNRQRAIQDMGIDLDLMQMQGGRGPVPNLRREVAPPQQMPEFNAPEFIPEPTGIGLNTSRLASPTLDAPDVPTLTVETNTPNPRFRPVGPEGFAYITDPGVMEREAADRKRSEEARSRQALLNRVSGPLDEVLRGEPTGRGIAELELSGINAERWVPEPEEPGWSPDTDPAIQRGEYWRNQGLSVTGQPLDEPEPAGGLKNPPSVSQAENILFNAYPGNEERSEAGMSPQLRLSLAQSWAEGNQLNLPDPRELASGVELPPEYYIAEPVHGSLHNTAPVPEPAPAPTPNRTQTTEAWRDDPQAVEAIKRIEQLQISPEEKERRIAEVKRIAAGG